MGLSTIFLIAAFACFLVETVRSRSLIAAGLALAVLSLLV